jgi:hypothetical protein
VKVTRWKGKEGPVERKEPASTKETHALRQIEEKLVCAEHEAAMMLWWGRPVQERHGREETGKAHTLKVVSLQCRRTDV